MRTNQAHDHARKQKNEDNDNDSKMKPPYHYRKNRTSNGDSGLYRKLIIAIVVQFTLIAGLMSSVIKPKLYLLDVSQPPDDRRLNDKSHDDGETVFVDHHNIDASKLPWKGHNPIISDETDNTSHPISIVISGCDERLHYWFDDIIKDVAVHKIYLLGSCPDTVKSLRSSTAAQVINYHKIGSSSATLAHSQWISSYLSSKKSQTNNNDDGVLVFLTNENHLPVFDKTTVMIQRHSRRRSISEMIKGVSSSEFSCLREPTGWSDADISSYYRTQKLLSFRADDKVVFGEITLQNMTDWLNLVNVDLPRLLTNMCNGGEFAVSSRRLTTVGGSNRDASLSFWKQWTTMVKKTTTGSLHHAYAERTWAGLFTKPLLKDEMAQMMRYNTGISMDEPFVGALVHHEYLTKGNRPEVSYGETDEGDESMDLMIDALWKGGVVSDEKESNGGRWSFDRVFIVISYCQDSLDWYDNFTKDVEIHETIIYSKCKTLIPDQPNFTSKVEFKLEDVGGFEHTFAHFMANIPPIITNNDAIVFLPDSIELPKPDDIKTYKTRRLIDILKIAASKKGFGCLRQLRNDDFSAYYSTPSLLSYTHISNTDKKNLGDWLTSLHSHLPKPLVEVCPHSAFAVNASHIRQYPPSFWKDMARSLSHSKDDRERQYAERSWAGLLSTPLTMDELAIMKMNKMINVEERDGEGKSWGVLTRKGGSRTVATAHEALWRGDAVGGVYADKRLHVVVFYCNSRLNWFDGFIHGFEISNVTVYAACGTHHQKLEKFREYNGTIIDVQLTNGQLLSEHNVYARWLGETDVSSFDDDKDVVIFLSGDPIVTEDLFFKRSLKEMVRIASVNGFGCLFENADHSAYRDTATLEKLVFNISNEDSPFDDMKHWLESTINVTLPKPYTNVCIGGNFAVKASQIKIHPPSLWISLQETLSEKSANTEDHCYAERTWAGLFSQPLSKLMIKTLRQSSTGITRTDQDVNRRYLGSLTRALSPPFYSEVDGLWRAEPVDPSVASIEEGDGGNSTMATTAFRRIFVVISHCMNPLDWVERFLEGVPVHNVTVYSKCIINPDDAPRGATLLRLPNVGRCDHTYAHWMATMSSSLHDDDAVIFIKDSLDFQSKDYASELQRSALQMLRYASSPITGFGCYLTNYRLSAYHLTSEMLRLKMPKYVKSDRDEHSMSIFNGNFSDMAHWLSSLGGSLPEPYSQVCYKGNFAVKASGIKRHPPSFWSAMATSLSRGDNIEEGHYAERSWGGLLSRPLSRENIRAVRHYAAGGRISKRIQGAIGRSERREYYFELDATWKGDSRYEVNDVSIFRRLILVVSFCRKSLAWLRDFTREFIIHETRIYCKCGIQPDYVPKGAKIIQLKKAGGYHHTYSFWMSEVNLKDIQDTDGIVFLPEDRHINDWGRPRTLHEMLKVASHNGFACQLTPAKSRDYEQSDVSSCHNIGTLLSFPSDGTKRNLKTWVKNMKIKLPEYITSVCYGDVFVVKGTRLKTIPKATFQKMEKSLSAQGEERIPRVDEYAQRIWAAMFTESLDINYVNLLKKYRTGHLEHKKYHGALTRNTII